MKKISTLCLLLLIAMTSMAVPAKRGWQTRTQADGSTIDVQLVGDEFYHYLVNRDGQQVREVNGMYEAVGSAPTVAKVQARRAQARRARKEFGKTPNLAPRGVVILVNFSNKSLKSSHTNATFTELCNSENCTVNNGYPSAREYFKSQSNGAYTPVFDVFGPVTLSQKYSYYGNNVDDEDEYATDAVIEACILANNKYSDLNFADYDSDGDGKVDFVYVIYAGYGEADGGGESTIWPHNYSIQDLLVNYPSYSKYTKSQTKLDGVYLDNYAMSNELDHYSDALTGIGTLCHEFGHVIGLPDFYETNYGTNYKNALTPNDWDVMDGGAYNEDGHCPPNYSPWEKYFFGWHTPINLGSEGTNLTLKANGTDGYQAYQINTSGKLISATTESECYYIENRQKNGWDAGLPHHGMLIWKVKYNASAWSNNAPNNDDTSGSPLYTIVSASGTKIGTHSNSDNSAYIYDGPKNPFPGNANVTTVTIAGKPLKSIAEKNGEITLIYIEEPTIPVDPFDITWKVNGTVFATTESTGKVVLPANEPAGCDGKVFVGWCSQADYSHTSTAPSFVKAGDAVSEGAVFYAVFATKSEGGAEETKTYTFTSKDWKDATSSWNSNKGGNQLTSGQGVQVTTGTTGAGAETKNELSDVTKVVVKYCTNATKGAGSLKVSVGSAEKSTNVSKNGGTSLREVTFTFDKASGKVAVEVTCTTNSIYIYSVAVTSGGGVSYSNYTTTCGGATEATELVMPEPAARKMLRNGQLVIVRDGVTYTVTGMQITNK